MRQLAALTAVLVGLSLPTAPAEAAPATCRGESATLVGVEGHELTGTDGDDVIVTNGASYVHALDGDDLICFTRNTFDVDAGRGDDVVDGTAATAGADADLGGGSDTFYGSDTYDQVDAGDRDEARLGLPLGTDVIDTGGNGDTVTTGADGLPNDDIVRLGPGKDDAVVKGMVPATLDGGTGRDTIRMQSSTPAAWRFDGRTGVFSVDGVAMAPAASFTAYDFTRLRWSSLVVHGGPQSERVYAQKLSFVVKDGPFSARMGAGNDLIEVRTGHTGPFNGGAGRDTVDLVNEDNHDLGGRFVGDLVRDYYQLQDTSRVAIKGVENLLAGDYSSGLLIGDAGDNRLGASGCGLVIRGGAGNDNLSGFQSKDCFDSGRRAVTIYGEAGNDLMDGSNIADVLIGGAGFDIARGRDGRDRCVAEKELDCER